MGIYITNISYLNINVIVNYILKLNNHFNKKILWVNGLWVLKNLYGLGD